MKSLCGSQLKRLFLEAADVSREGGGGGQSGHTARVEILLFSEVSKFRRQYSVGYRTGKLERKWSVGNRLLDLDFSWFSSLPPDSR
jgi:hypothetical protein